MPKLKTKAAAKKRFKVTANGKVRGGFAFKSHNLRKRPQDMKNKARGTTILAEADAKNVKRLIPYA